MTNFAKKYLDLSYMLRELDKEVNPLKNRFYDFLSGNDELHGYLEYSIEDLREKPPVRQYELSVWELGEGTGMKYTTEVFDYDCSSTLHFTVPDEYLADPDKFESELLAKIAKSYVDAKAVLNGVFGEGVGDAVEFTVSHHDYATIDYVDSEKKFLMIHLVKGGKNLGKTDAHRYILSMAKATLVWDTETGHLYFGGYSTTNDVAKGLEVDSLGQFLP